MSARGMKNDYVGSKEPKTPRGYSKTLKAETFKPVAGNSRRSDPQVWTDSLKLICAEKEKTQERISRTLAGRKITLLILGGCCPGKYSEKPTSPWKDRWFL